jgi:hypothetical protein
MHGAESGDALGRCQQAGRPGDGLERRTLVVGLAPVTLPPPDREQEVDTRLIRHARQPQIVGPAPAPALGYLGDRPSRRAIGAEQADLELVGVVHRVAVARGGTASKHVSSPLSIPTRGCEGIS